MDDVLYQMIFKRKSFHLFRNAGAESILEDELTDIQNAYRHFIPFYSEIRTGIRIVPCEETTCKRGEEYCILLYSEKKDGYLQNIGYLGEQLDLYLASKEIGALWFGIGKTEESLFQGMEFVIMIAVHKIDDASKFRRDMYKSKRKPLEEIWQGDILDGVTEIVRFAPSACNTQPWFVRNSDELSVFRYQKPGKRGIMPTDKVSYYNQIDMGIFLCFMDLCLQHCRLSHKRELFHDDGSDREMTLNAIYRLD